jgi:hypothetical protein
MKSPTSHASSTRLRAPAQSCLFRLTRRKADARRSYNSQEDISQSFIPAQAAERGSDVHFNNTGDGDQIPALQSWGPKLQPSTLWENG